MPSPLFIPLASAFGYPIAAMMLKRATENGGGPWRITFITNWVLAACFSVLWLFPVEHAVSLANLGHAFVAALLFFIGQLFTFLALSRGDVSVATPVLGSKVIFVALFTVLLGATVVTPAMWCAVLLTAAATALLGGGGKVQRDALFRSLLYGFSAATVFGLTDVLQQRWVRLWGFPHFAAMMFLWNALLSLTLIPFFRGSLRALPALSWRWAVGGGATLALQASGIAWGIVYIGATTTNVLYNSRGIWSVVLVWTIGHWFGNTERHQGRAVMVRRLCGSALLLVAIALIARRPAV
ncbi:MAG: DMT family transporter [Chthoniobacteraceae bacterium]